MQLVEERVVIGIKERDYHMANNTKTQPEALTCPGYQMIDNT